MTWPRTVDPADGLGRTGSPADEGSTFPFIIGIFVIALYLVAGAVAAGDAFIQQSDLHSLCDGAAVAATSVDVDAERITLQTSAGDQTASGFVVLASVQDAVSRYVSRDAARSAVTMRAALTSNLETAVVDCVQIRPITFGALFGLGGGVRHHVVASARSSSTAG